MSFLHKCRVIIPNIKTFVILPNDINVIMNSLDYGIDDYLIKDSFTDQDLLCRVSRLLNFHIHTNIYISNFRNMYLDKYQKQLYFKNYRIKLTYMETLFIDYLIENKGFVKRNKLISYMQIQLGSNYEVKALVMMLSRLKKKVRYITGLDLIKNKYSVGYYIP